MRDTMHHNQSRENAREHQDRHLREVGALTIGPPSKIPNPSPASSPIKEKHYRPIPSETQNGMPKPNTREAVVSSPIRDPNSRASPKPNFRHARMTTQQSPAQPLVSREKQKQLITR